MKENFIHVCFVVDKSGSMYSSKNDVIGGFKKVIDEQKAMQEGQCSVSLFTFNGAVREDYLGRDVHEINGLDDYEPSGMTAMNDGIGTAIDRVGEWLRDMPESERPEQNLIVIMTDGEENSSHKYTLAKVKEMIQHQTEKYSWRFMYIGTDITTTKDADELGIKMSAFSSRSNYGQSYDIINSATCAYRMSKGISTSLKLANMDSSLTADADALTSATETEVGVKIK
jgi:uncharacterized protein YegL